MGQLGNSVSVNPTTLEYFDNETNLMKPEYIKQYILAHSGERTSLDATISLIYNQGPRAMKTRRENVATKLSFLENHGVAVNVAAAAAGATITVTIPATQHSLSGTYSGPRIGELVELSRSVGGFRRQGRIITKTPVTNATTVTIRPEGNFDMTGGGLTAGVDSFIRFGITPHSATNPVAERADLEVESLTQGVVFDSYGMELMSESDSISGHAYALSQSWINNALGEPQWAGESLHDMNLRFNKEWQYRLLSRNPDQSNPAITGTGDEAMTGLLPFVETAGAAGSAQIVNVPGAIGLSHFRAMGLKVQQSQQGITKYLDLCSFQFMNNVEDYQLSLTNSGGQTPTLADFSSSVQIKCRKMMIAGLEYNFHLVDEFQNIRGMGAGNSYDKICIRVPVGVNSAGKPLAEIIYAQGRWDLTTRKGAVPWVDGQNSITVDKNTVTRARHAGTSLKNVTAWGLFN